MAETLTCGVSPRRARVGAPVTSGRPSYPVLPVGWKAMTDNSAPEVEQTDEVDSVDLATETEAERSLGFVTDALKYLDLI